MLTKTLIHG